MNAKTATGATTCTAGVDVGSGAVKAVVMAFGDGHAPEGSILAKVSSRIRRRDLGAEHLRPGCGEQQGLRHGG